MLNHLARHNPDLVSPLVVCSGEGVLTQRLRAMNIPVQILPINREREFFRRFSLPHILTLIRLWRWLRQNQIDLIHSYTLETRNYAHAIALLSGLPLFHTSQDTWFGNMFGRAQWKAMNRIPQRVIATSQTVCESLKVGNKLRSDLVALIKPGIDLEYFRPMQANQAIRSEFHIPANSPIVGAMGRLSSVKGWDIFLEVARRIHKIRPDVHFLVVGGAVLADDNYADTIAIKINSLALNQVVHLTGFRDDTPHIISAMQVLVSTSPKESFGLVLAEAGACAKPTVSVRNGGAQEIIIPERTGLLAEVGNIEDITSKVLTLLNDPTRCLVMGEAARRHIEMHFDIRHMVSQIEREYLDVALTSLSPERLCTA